MKTPWHLWLVGIISLLWNAMGAFDYTMTKLRVAAYMGNFTPQQLEYFYGFPVWVNAAWAIGVWFGVLGSILLLMRSTLAIWSFVASFLGIAAASLNNFILSEVSMRALMGKEAAVFSAAIGIVGFLLIWYARAMKTKGLLN